MANPTADRRIHLLEFWTEEALNVASYETLRVTCSLLEIAAGRSKAEMVAQIVELRSTLCTGRDQDTTQGPEVINASVVLANETVANNANAVLTNVTAASDRSATLANNTAANNASGVSTDDAAAAAGANQDPTMAEALRWAKVMERRFGLKYDEDDLLLFDWREGRVLLDPQLWILGTIVAPIKVKDEAGHLSESGGMMEREWQAKGVSPEKITMLTNALDQIIFTVEVERVVKAGENSRIAPLRFFQRHGGLIKQVSDLCHDAEAGTMRMSGEQRRKIGDTHAARYETFTQAMTVDAKLIRMPLRRDREGRPADVQAKPFCRYCKKRIQEKNFAAHNEVCPFSGKKTGRSGESKKSESSRKE